uniref:Peptidase A2 domain-containing protein n=1 Tax=Trieres chinensis TaxID=1514140 RepID=A0A7S1ZM78_TRICV|mmetsp:Transcript_28400/g.58100  ORF Transcript_28400/g.58100 Transcript_28400/m.58100 type:complete len:256 (+) Transcript_28400:33-800(+)|eukprot:CAMPEP_0183291104 /NCGR_PEP_ID=MMETSP0160_2-20130417/639_1 /TAXON_ID=2839 ORGANISM="Odontella Sinensis, Strain Grunow 1884" /NCGR_SAMPLE_ID=MMETSP0160_2 /ASSEMBLY_ACC=CAM_ASM_000250 /LENGTH=255 /DNA_ID=CAMNT_0025451859 /DNA_START=31 /DNA_END=798 /DNA_ORIENTATION=+
MTDHNKVTANDAAIAAALAQQENDGTSSSFAAMSDGILGFSPEGVPIVQGRNAFNANNPQFTPHRSREATSHENGNSGTPLARTGYGPRTVSSSSPSGLLQRNPHMCEVACIVGDGICVEMMVDSGAQTSVMSTSLARMLGLMSNIDTREQGVAAGVGRARIIGRIRNIVCTLGNVEFDMDFMVLDVPDKLMLLGLDQLRRFKCVIDLEKEVLVFGGQGGVEVPMLPPSECHVDYRSVVGEQCSVMPCWDGGCGI